MGSTKRGLPPRKDSTQPSFMVEMTWPARGPKLSVIQLPLSPFIGFSYYASVLSSSFFTCSTCYSLISDSSFFSSFSYCTSCFFTSFFTYTFFSCTALMSSRMKINPIICSLANGPDPQASQNPFWTAVKSSTVVVLYSSSNLINSSSMSSPVSS